MKSDSESIGPSYAFKMMLRRSRKSQRNLKNNKNSQIYSPVGDNSYGVIDKKTTEQNKGRKTSMGPHTPHKKYGNLLSSKASKYLKDPPVASRKKE